MWAGRQISWVPRVNQHALLEPTNEPIDASGKEGLLGVIRAGAMGGAGEEGAQLQSNRPRRIHVLANSTWLCLACELALVSRPQLQRLRVHSPSSHRDIARSIVLVKVVTSAIALFEHLITCLASPSASTEHDGNLHDAWIDGAPMLEWRRS